MTWSASRQKRRDPLAVRWLVQQQMVAVARYLGTDATKHVAGQGLQNSPHRRWQDAQFSTVLRDRAARDADAMLQQQVANAPIR